MVPWNGGQNCAVWRREICTFFSGTGWYAMWIQGSFWPSLYSPFFTWLPYFEVFFSRTGVRLVDQFCFEPQAYPNLDHSVAKEELQYLEPWIRTRLEIWWNLQPAFMKLSHKLVKEWRLFPAHIEQGLMLKEWQGKPQNWWYGTCL